VRPEEFRNLIGNGTRDLPACSIVPQPVKLPMDEVTGLLDRCHSCDRCVYLSGFPGYSVMQSRSADGHITWRLTHKTTFSSP
jgi:hypothetical protein